MHLVKDYIREMAQEGATLTNEAHLHLKQCGECSNLFQMFVLHRFYTERTYDHQTRSLRARRRVSPTSEELLELV
jgi:hypothetical protein